MKAVWYSFSLFLGLGLLYACSNASSSGSTESLSEAATINNAVPIPEPEKEIMVKISTDFGDMTVKLYNETPQHRDNFVKLAREGFYNGTLFHRVISGFMIQGGDPTSRTASPNQPLGNGGPGYTIPAEFNSKFIHKKGALAGARQGDQVNPQRRSSGSQFYIVQGRGGNPNVDRMLDQLESNLNFKYTTAQREIYKTIGGTPHLDMQYTVFGEIVEGLNVVDSIAAVKTKAMDRPEKDVKITVSVIDDKVKN